MMKLERHTGPRECMGSSDLAIRYLLKQVEGSGSVWRRGLPIALYHMGGW